MPDPDEFDEFVRSCGHRLYRTACLLSGGDRASAEDLSSEALARVYLAWPRVRAGDAYGYARRIMVNLHIDWWRRVGRRRETITDRVPEEPDPTDIGIDAARRDSVVRALGRDFSGKHLADPTHRFLSAQVPLGPHSVLDMGVYSRRAARISVASAGQPTDAHLLALSPNGWTLFWVRRDAAPLPDGAATTEIPYQGPEQLTLTAYAADGAVEQTADGASENDGRFIGLSPQSLANVGSGSAGMGAPPCPGPDPTRS